MRGRNGSTPSVPGARRFKVPSTILKTIEALAARLKTDQSPRARLCAAAFDEPELLAHCARCKQPVRFNPFAVDNPLALEQ
jgi:hypothetical protein